jgi:pimeloyl-ACP methyl ester carboxylesterase
MRGGSGRPVLLLHHDIGTLDRLPFYDSLAEKFDVIVPNHPGFGVPERPQWLRHPRDIAALYQWLLADLSVESASLVGLGYGGWIAAEMAALRPKEVGKLALLAPVGLWRDESPVVDLFGLTIGELLPFLFHDMKSAAARNMSQLTTLMSDKDDRTQAQIDQLIAIFLGFRTAAKFLFPVPDTGLERRLWRIRVPTLVLWGAQDRLIAPSYAELIAKRVRNAQVVTIERCGHLSMAEQPEATAKEIQRFAGI